MMHSIFLKREGNLIGNISTDRAPSLFLELEEYPARCSGDLCKKITMYKTQEMLRIVCYNLKIQLVAISKG
jgi:hypothetical protein